MTDQLYQDRIVALAKAKTGAGKLASPTKSARRDNPLCGDRVTIDISAKDGRVTAVGHQVRGCLLCEAAAATIAEYCRDVGRSELDAIGTAARTLMAEGGELPAAWQCLEIFRPVHQAKSRRDCVLLPFEALRRAASGIL